jgi:hypothetical protein
MTIRRRGRVSIILLPVSSAPFVELFTPAVRATAASFVFNGARLIAWIFPIIAGTLVTTLGGVAQAALIMSSIYVIGADCPLVHARNGRQAVAGMN